MKGLKSKPPNNMNVCATEEEQTDPESKLAGIGIVFSIGPDQGFYIKSMMTGSAAEDCGILSEGDCLVAVDGKEIFGKTADYVTKKILGKIGT